MKLQFKKLEETAIIPEFKTEGSAGMDISSIEDVSLAPGQFKIVKTGLACAIEPGYEVQVRPRSGMACKHGITVINTPGTIDSDYRGEIGVGLINLSQGQFDIKKGDRIAQLVVNKIEQPIIKVVDELDETERGTGGFGSTGKN
jgi:dUTP pyrophosphatase